MLEAVARLTHDRRAERQKAIDMEELKSRAKLTTVSADPPTQMIELSSVVGDCGEVRSVERAQVEPRVRSVQSAHGRLPETRRGRHARAIGSAPSSAFGQELHCT